MTMTPSRRVAGVVLTCILIVTAARGAGAQQPAAAQGNAAEQTATIRGVVLDRADGSPIADVSVRLQEAKQTVTTDDAGRFELTGVQPGRRTLYVSVVGFILVKRPVEIAPGATLELTIALSEGTGTYSENVTVVGRALPRAGEIGARAADARQRRDPEPAQPADERSDARHPGAAGRHDRRRLPQRVRRPRQPLQPHELHVRRRPDLVPAAHRAAGAGRRIDRHGERRHPRRHHAAERIVPAALRQPSRRAARFPHARGIARSVADRASASAAPTPRSSRRVRSAAPRPDRGWSRRARAISSCC